MKDNVTVKYEREEDGRLLVTCQCPDCRLYSVASSLTHEDKAKQLSMEDRTEQIAKQARCLCQPFEFSVGQIFYSGDGRNFILTAVMKRDGVGADIRLMEIPTNLNQAPLDDEQQRIARETLANSVK